MVYIIYACDKLTLNSAKTHLYPGEQCSGLTTESPLNKYATLTLGIFDYMKPNENKTYFIFKKSVLKESIYWAPRWHSVYTSDKHRYYYDSNKTPTQNLNVWVKVYKDTLLDYSSNFTYNEIGIPQNEIVYDKPIDLQKYVEWVIY